MKNERVLITGCGGMLGLAVYSIFLNATSNIIATDIDQNEKWLHYLDVSDMQACERVFKEFEPSIVLHLAALTDLEYCEKNQADTWRVNVTQRRVPICVSMIGDCSQSYTLLVFLRCV